MPSFARSRRRLGPVALLIFSPIVFLGLLGRPCCARGPADELLALVPADAGATLVVEDLRGHAHAFLDSPLARSFRALPNVKAWIASPGYQKFQAARREIEKTLKVDLATVRDELLGDAVVLALRVPDGSGPDGAEGVLLVRVRDRALLDRLIATLNAAEKEEGVLREVGDRHHAGVSYFVRQFPAGTKPDEYYAILGQDILVWSNSEALVRATIDRRGKSGGLTEDSRFRAVRDALPAHAAASLFVDPRFVERLAAASGEQAGHADDDPIGPILARYIAAVNYAGAALEWRDGLILHVHELVDPSKLDGPWRSWARRTGGADALLSRVPSTALGLAAGNVDLLALYDEVMTSIPETARIKAENIVTVVRGILLGKDPRTEILSVLGPGMVLYVDEPRAAWAKSTPALVLAIAVGGTGEQAATASAAVENALNTLLALWTLDNKHPENSRLRVQTWEIDGVRVAGLAGERSPLAFSVGAGFIVIGSAPEAVAGFAAQKHSAADAQFVQLRTDYFPKAGTFAYVDLDRVARFAAKHRVGIIKRIAKDHDKPEAKAGHDFDQALALMGLFRAAFATSAVADDFSWAHRSLGFIARTK